MEPWTNTSPVIEPSSHGGPVAAAEHRIDAGQTLPFEDDRDGFPLADAPRPEDSPGNVDLAGEQGHLGARSHEHLLHFGRAYGTSAAAGR